MQQFGWDVMRSYSVYVYLHIHMHQNVRLLFVVQYVSTSPRDDWIVQDCGVVGSSRSAECASQPHECDEEEEPGMQLDVRDFDCFFVLVCLLCSISMSVLVVHVHVVMVQWSIGSLQIVSM